jgi:branched-chain amino acid transport system ATP-binding protein
MRAFGAHISANAPDGSVTTHQRPCALEVVDLNAFYDKAQVVFDVSLGLSSGETLALLGRNGAGKTTTLLAIAGVVKTEARAIRLAGSDIGGLPPFRRVRRGLVLVPSGGRVFPNLTVGENLELTAGGGDGARWTFSDVFSVFPVLEPLVAVKAVALSGGERQILGFARALASGPRVLMLDEPSEGLAPFVLRDLAARIREINNQGVAVLLSEQNHRFALQSADHAIFLERGRVAWEGTAVDAGTEKVLARYLSV